MSVWLVGGIPHQLNQLVSKMIAERTTPIAFASELSKADKQDKLSQKSWLRLASQIIEASDDNAVFAEPLHLHTYASLTAAPGISLLLLYPSPAQVIQQALNTACSRADIEAAMNRWQAAVDQLIAIKQENPSNVVLASLEEIAAAPEVFYSEISSRNPHLAIEFALEPPSPEAQLLDCIFKFDNKELASTYANALKLSESAQDPADVKRTDGLVDLALAAARASAPLSELASLKTQLDEQQQVIDILQAEIDGLEASNADVTEQFNLASNSEIPSLKAQLAELTTSKSALQDQLDVVSGYNTDLKKTLLLRDASIDKLELTVEPIKEYCDQLESQCSAYESEIDNYKEALANAKAEIESYKEALANAKAEIESYKEAVVNAKAEIESYKEALANAKAEIESYKETLEAVTAQSSSYSEENSTLLNTNRSLEDRILAVESEKAAGIDSVKAELTQALNGQRDLEAQIYVANSQLEQLFEELERSLGNQIMTNAIVIPNAPQKCTSTAVEIMGKYSEDGYEDLKLKLFDFNLADGRQFDELAFKIVKSAEAYGVEIRPSEINEDIATFSEQFSDEFGPYFLFFPSPTDSLYADQQRLNELLNASDRLLILSLLNHVSDAICFGDLRASIAIDDSELAQWKLTAIELAKQASNLPTWISTDGLECIEQFNSDGYEHTWLRFDKLLLNNRFYQTYEFKFTAKGSVTGDLFAEEFGVELREFNGTISPLEYWPPGSSDEWGNFLYLGATQESVVNSNPLHLSDHDKVLLRELLSNYGNWMALLAASQELPRSLNEYESAGELYNKIAASITSGIESSHEDYQEDTDKVESSESTEHGHNQLLPIFEILEVTVIETYEHLCLKTQFNAHDLTVKYQAFDVDNDNEQCRITLEIRGETEAQVPLSNSEFFGVDEWGPRLSVDVFNEGELDRLRDLAELDGQETLKLVNDSVQQLQQLPEIEGISNQTWSAALRNM